MVRCIWPLVGKVSHDFPFLPKEHDWVYRESVALGQILDAMNLFMMLKSVESNKFTFSEDACVSNQVHD